MPVVSHAHLDPESQAHSVKSRAGCRTLPALEAAEEKPCAPRRSLETFRMAAHPAKFAGEGQGAQQREVTLKVSDDTCEKHPTWKQVSAEQCQSPLQLARRTYCFCHPISKHPHEKHILNRCRIHSSLPASPWQRLRRSTCYLTCILCIHVLSTCVSTCFLTCILCGMQCRAKAKKGPSANAESKKLDSGLTYSVRNETISIAAVLALAFYHLFLMVAHHTRSRGLGTS
jgi:hypothetical protein